jgi:PKD repeat protein
MKFLLIILFAAAGHATMLPYAQVPPGMVSQETLLGDAVMTLDAPDDIPQPRPKAAKILLQSVNGTIYPGEFSTASATLYDVSTYSDNVFYAQYPTGYAPPSFISVSDLVSVAPTNCCGPPSVAFKVSVDADATPGTYDFIVEYAYYTRVLNIYVGLEWVSVRVVIPSPPTANFFASASGGVAPLSVAFTNTTSGTATSFSWSFGDGATSSSTSPTHTYSSAGTYRATLTATNPSGSTGAYLDISVTSPPAPPPPAPVGTAPVASFYASPSSGDAPLAVQFTNQSSGQDATYAWNFGDGGSSADLNPSHTYTVSGTYTARLVATNSVGSNEYTQTITVSTAPSSPPSGGGDTSPPPSSGGGDTSPPPSSGGTVAVDFTAERRTGTVPFEVKFSSLVAGTQYFWDFGDGATSGDKNPTHVYEIQGVYTVSFRANLASGSGSIEKPDYITATVPGVAELIGETTSIDLGKVLVGTEASAIVSVRNDGTADATSYPITILSPDRRQFNLSYEKVTVPAGGRSDIIVTITPTEARDYEAVISIDFGSEFFETVIRFEAYQPLMSADVSSVDLGVGDFNELSTRTITLTNSTEQTLELTELKLSSASFSVSEVSMSINGSASKEVLLTGLRSVIGTNQDTLQLVVTSPSHYEIFIPVTCDVRPPAALDLNLEPLVFGEIDVGTISTESVIVKNVGSSTLITTLNVDNTNFGLGGLDSLHVEAGRSREIDVLFLPNRTGTYTADLIINTNDPDQPEVVLHLSGVGARTVQESPIVFDANPESGNQQQRNLSAGMGRPRYFDVLYEGLDDIAGYGLKILISPSESVSVPAEYFTVGVAGDVGILPISRVLPGGLIELGGVIRDGYFSTRKLGEFGVMCQNAEGTTTTLRLIEVSVSMANGEHETFDTDEDYEVICSEARDGDIDGSGTVDFLDFFKFADEFGKTGADLKSDLNSDQVVDFSDFFLFVDLFSSPEQAKLMSMARTHLGMSEVGLSTHPNPFNSQASLVFSLTHGQTISIEIYDMSGQLVRLLYHGQGAPGYNRFSWNGRDDKGSEVASGLYIARLMRVDGIVATKLTLIR